MFLCYVGESARSYEANREVGGVNPQVTKEMRSSAPYFLSARGPTSHSLGMAPVSLNLPQAPLAPPPQTKIAHRSELIFIVVEVGRFELPSKEVMGHGSTTRSPS